MLVTFLKLNIMKYAIRIGIFIVGIIALIQINQYLFNHVNPWLGILATVIGAILLLGLAIDTIKKIYNQNNN